MCCWCQTGRNRTFQMKEFNSLPMKIHYVPPHIKPYC